VNLPYNPSHPGEILLEEFLIPLGLTQSAFAQHIGVPFKRINEIVKGKRSISPESAWLFSKAFGNSPEFWMGLQTTYDLVHNKTDRKVARIKIAS
jgi:addiction module HigA family antidote